jgi:hypothetical protein
MILGYVLQDAEAVFAYRIERNAGGGPRGFEETQNFAAGSVEILKSQMAFVHQQDEEVGRVLDFTGDRRGVGEGICRLGGLRWLRRLRRGGP